ncbi:cyclic nucleotide-binding domain-containing protein, partial [Staphylococcus aureus]
AKISPRMKRDALRSCWFFQPMQVEELDEIVLHSVERRVPRRTTIFHRGDAGSSLMAVLAGQVDIRLGASEGNKEIT